MKRVYDTELLRRMHHATVCGYTETSGQSGGGGNRGMRARAFLVVFMRRNQGGRGGDLGLPDCSNLAGSGLPCSPEFYSICLRAIGQAMVAWKVKTTGWATAGVGYVGRCVEDTLVGRAFILSRDWVAGPRGQSVSP